MKISGALKTNINYARNLAEAGMDGILSARSEVEGLGAAPDVVRDIFMPIAIGAGIGLVSGYLSGDRNSKDRILARGLIGGAAGLCVGAGWRSRNFARFAVHRSVTKINGVRDDYWLKKNPVAYG